jgi:hypothetical protein
MEYFCPRVRIESATFNATACRYWLKLTPMPASKARAKAAASILPEFDNARAAEVPDFRGCREGPQAESLATAATKTPVDRDGCVDQLGR